MTPDVFSDRKLYGILLAGSIAVFVVLKCCACGSGSPTQQAVKTAGYVIRANCADMMTVAECLDVLEQNAAIVDQALDGGR